MVTFTVDDSKDESQEENDENDEPIPILKDGEPNEELTNDSNNEPQFSDSMMVAGLKEAIENYTEWCVSHFDCLSTVDLSDVPISVSRELKRTAGKVMHKKRGSGSDIRMRFAYGAYQQWGWEQFKQTIRHELIHVWQIQECGKGDHGRTFKKKANLLDCSVHCERFTDYKYELFCDNCGQFVGGRYQRSKIVKNPTSYNSKCCGSDLTVEKA